MIEGLGCWDLGFRVLGFRVVFDLGFRGCWDLGFRVGYIWVMQEGQGLGFRGFARI